jgi:hypothetical protein
MFALSVASFTVHYRITPAYWFSNINEQYFNRPYETTVTNFNGTTTNETEQFIGIGTRADIYEYLTEFFKPNFLSVNASDSPNFLNDKKILYGPYRIHTVNVNLDDCSRGVDISAFNGTQNSIDYSVKCLKYQYSLKDSISKANITSSSQGTYRSASEVKIDYTLSGEYHKYTGDGFTWDVYPSKMNQSEFQSELVTLIESGEFIGEQNVVFILSFICYSKDLDMWSYDIAYLEKNLQGVIYTHLPFSQVFEPNKFETNVEIFFLAVDCLKVAIIFIVS